MSYINILVYMYLKSLLLSNYLQKLVKGQGHKFDIFGKLRDQKQYAHMIFNWGLRGGSGYKKLTQ